MRKWLLVHMSVSTEIVLLVVAITLAQVGWTSLKHLGHSIPQQFEHLVMLDSQQ